MQAFNSGGQETEQASFKPLSRRKPTLDHESIYADSGQSYYRLKDLLARCIVALRVAGSEVVRSSLATKDTLDHVQSKGKTLEGVDDIVTGSDLRSHNIIVNTIKDGFHRLTVVSEEDTNHGHANEKGDKLPIRRDKFAKILKKELEEIGEQHVEWDSLLAQHQTLVWVDPLDATKEYSENLTNYVTLMGCIVHKEIPIAGIIYKPFKDLMYWSIMDIPSGKYHHSTNLITILSGEKTKSNTTEPKDKMTVIVSRSHAGNVESRLRKLYGQDVSVIAAGGSGYKTIELLERNADAYIHLTRIKKWDICAPNAIVNSIGGKFTNLAGDVISYGDKNDKIVEGGIVVSLDTDIHKQIVQKFNHG